MTASDEILDYIEVDGFGCVSNAKVFGLKSSIRGAKLPLSADPQALTDTLTNGIKALAQSQPGSGHDQWLTGVVVQFDLTFSNKVWVEAQRYHFLEFISSQSTMHRMTKFPVDAMYNKYVDPRVIEIVKQKIALYNAMSDEDKERKAELYLEILYTNPAGFMLTARMTTNYRQLKTIYSQRKTHRLPEWVDFCKWIETLPCAYLITGDNVDG